MYIPFSKYRYAALRTASGLHALYGVLSQYMKAYVFSLYRNSVEMWCYLELSKAVGLKLSSASVIM